MTKLIKKLDNDKNYEFFFEKKFFLADSFTEIIYVAHIFCHSSAALVAS